MPADFYGWVFDKKNWPLLSEKEKKSSGKITTINIDLAKSILHPSAVEDLRSHKLKRLVPRPNSYFMDIKCPGCYKIKTVFSHVQDRVRCDGCLIVLCRPTGGKGKLSDVTDFNKKSGLDELTSYQENLGGLL